ncbi:MAG: nitroreductase family protein [Desulfovermiculus sp.]|nr:nitroreductase family protein [Desulfovermiculus sp.]
MNKIIIDSEKCLQDGLCIQECPFGIFAPSENGVPTVAAGAEAGCINCGHCIALCPGAAITVNGLGPEDCDPVHRDLAVSREQVVQFFRSRRSIRSYKNEAVEPSTLEELLNISRWAPTAKNVQPVNWIVLQNANDVAELSAMVIDWMRTKQIQPDIVQAYEQGWDIIHRGAPCLLVAHAPNTGIKPVEDCCIAAATVEAAAPAFGLGACWAGFFMSATMEHQPINDFLQLPEGHRVYAALMLGYPQYTYRRIPPRKELQVEWR